MERNEAIKFILLRSVGNFLVLFAIFGVFATFGPALYYEIQFKIIQARGVHFKVADTTSGFGQLLDQQTGKTDTSSSSVSLGDLLTGSTDQTLTPVDTEFSIVIPKIGASAKIFPNVNPDDESDFLPKLLQGVAHAQGSVFPGLAGNIYLFAHSSDNFWDAGRYNAIFYLLKDLQEGDQIVIFYQGKRYDYYMTKSEIVDPSEVHFITEAKTGVEQLILQTCWPPGTSWKRLLVFARPRKTDTIFKQ